MDSLLLLNQSLNEFEEYPQNLIEPNALSHTLEAYSGRLADRSEQLFNERRCKVDFLDYHEKAQAFRENRVGELRILKEQLNSAFQPGQSDPQCRFIFIHAPSGRAALSISSGMLKLLFTYHQVMPAFVDFVFPFGNMVAARDFHFSGLREEFRLDPGRRGIEIRRLGRSGQELRLCYNLRSVERSGSNPKLPWSVRQSAVYHSFDPQTGQVLWVNVKGNELLKSRITEASSRPPLSKANSKSETFSASLTIHLLFCEWAGENWRWYINDLEDRLQELTRDALVTPVEKPPTPPSSPIPSIGSPRPRIGTFSSSSRATTGLSAWYPRTFSSSAPSQTTTIAECLQAARTSQDNHCTHDKWARSGFADVKTMKKSFNSLITLMKKIGARDFWQSNGTCKACSSLDEKSQAPSTFPMAPKELPLAFSDKSADNSNTGITFADLQTIQHIEEKAQDVLIHLRLNIDVLEELKQHYEYAALHSEFPTELKSACKDDLVRFCRYVLAIEKDLRTLSSRTDTLLSLVANRKALLNGILQHRSVKATQNSTVRMEQITDQMYAIAKKTEQETVSMRVITTVTLFFLPATFIATFMSTDILKFKDGDEKLQIQGLRIYLAVALPMTFLTFVAWFFIYQCAKTGGTSRKSIREESV